MDYDSGILNINLFVLSSNITSTPAINIGLFFLFLFILIFLSFIVSGAEVAFFSLNRNDLKKIESDYRSHKILHLLAQPKELLASLIIANTLINIFIVLLVNMRLDAFLNKFIHNHFYLETTKILIEIFIIIFFSEVLPKTLASRQNIKFALQSLPITLFFFKLFYKISLKLNKITSLIENRVANYVPQMEQHKLEELKHAIELTCDKEDKKEEILLINSIMDFKNKSAKQIMKSKIDVKALPIETTFNNLKKEILNLQYSRIPIYKNSIDNIVGILSTKKILAHLHKKTNFNWKTLTDKPVYVLENQSLESCLRVLQIEQAQIAVVVDEYGITQGLLTFEDIVEEVVGEIKDEFDENEINIKKIDKKIYDFDAKISLQDFSNFLNISIRYFDDIRNDSDSLAGLLLELFQSIPNEKESIIWNSLKFTVIKAKQHRLLKIRVQILN